ncbi:response regulator [Paucibacter sp. O1-1]|nr:response regulator [Paucibacter sp. O1-1]MDA3826015.1 response regulator [Paucibacter sp. O1-1]
MGEGQTVHLADDDEDDRMLYAGRFEEANPNVTIIEAQDGKELVENVKSADDLSETVVLVDMNMPKMNGIEAIKEIRSEPELSDVPAVIIDLRQSRAQKESPRCGSQ